MTEGFSIKCARCGECCKETSMELSEEDILRLVHLGHRREDICIEGEDGLPRLRNIDGQCVFLSKDGKSCLVYEHRPLGCEIYPVNCDEQGAIFVDTFCRASGTVTKPELRRKGKSLTRHMRRIDAEAKTRKEKKE